MATTTRQPATERTRREDAAARLMQATEELIREGATYTEIPMQRIAERAGMARSTLYLYFPDKSQLLIALAQQATEGLFDTALHWWGREHDDGIDGPREAMRAMVSAFREHLHLLQALSEVSAYDSDVAAYWFGRIGGFVDVLADRLTVDQTAGRIGPELQPRATAELLTWMVERTIAVHCRLDPGEGDERLALDLGRAIWLTVYGDAPASPPSRSAPALSPATSGLPQPRRAHAVTIHER